MDGFWTIQFQGVEGWGTGFVTLIDGQVFGGDEGYLYIGTYSGEDGNFSATVHVSQFVSGIANVMGVTDFDLVITGLEMVGAARQKTLHIEGRIPGTEMKLTGALTKRGDLPSRK
jgi:hypothetical protein